MNKSVEEEFDFKNYIKMAAKNQIRLPDSMEQKDAEFLTALNQTTTFDQKLITGTIEPFQSDANETHENIWEG